MRVTQLLSAQPLSTPQPSHKRKIRFCSGSSDEEISTNSDELFVQKLLRIAGVDQTQTQPIEQKRKSPQLPIVSVPGNNPSNPVTHPHLH